MSDLFYEDLPFQQIDQIVAIMVLADWHTFQPLTKRYAGWPSI
jgi:protein gp37